MCAVLTRFIPGPIISWKTAFDSCGLPSPYSLAHRQIFRSSSDSPERLGLCMQFLNSAGTHSRVILQSTCTSHFFTLPTFCTINITPFLSIATVIFLLSMLRGGFSLHRIYMYILSGANKTARPHNTNEILFSVFLQGNPKVGDKLKKCR